LNNQDGANLELRDARKEGALLERPLVALDDVDDDLVERAERIEDWEGDVLKLPSVTPNKAFDVDGSSGGRSLIIWRGLSSIGGILDDRIDLVEIMEFRCDIRERLSKVDRYDDAMTVPLPDDVKEFRFAPGGLDSGFSAKMSKSNFSASRFRMEISFWFGELSLKNVGF
jgi:hypothetical protein